MHPQRARTLRRAGLFGAVGLLVCGASAVGSGAQAASPSHPPSDAPAAESRDSRGTACSRDTDGDVTVNVPFEDGSYNVTVHIPPTAPDAELPLVLNLHGSGGTGAGQLSYSEMRETADAHGFLLAAPDGALPQDDGYAWNVPGVTPDAPRDDVAFLRATIDAVTSGLCGDTARVYVTGFSGGGRMASALACEASDQVAAVAPVAGLRAGRPDGEAPVPESCAPGRSVPVTTFHGEQDETNPFDGGGTEYWQYSVPVALERWAEIDGCAPEPSTEQLTEHVSRISYQDCADGTGVVLHDIDDGGHTWPGSPHDRDENTNREIDANELMWEFFEHYTLPAV